MTNQMMFNDLPATFPVANPHKIWIGFSSTLIHITLLTALVIIPLWVPPAMESWRLITMIAQPPLPPPPAAASMATPMRSPAPVVRPAVELATDALIAPVMVPREIARVIDDSGGEWVSGGVPGGVAGGVVGGVVGGVPGGVVGGFLGSILHAGIGPAGIAPPPPPPPVQAPPAPAVAAAIPIAPVRVGGDVKPPRAIRVVPSVYPAMASKARVEGTVTLEAILTEEGLVAEIKVVSGHPLLTEAAINCVRQWQYEPTYLNGRPVPIIMTATVKYELRHN